MHGGDGRRYNDMVMRTQINWVVLIKVTLPAILVRDTI